MPKPRVATRLLVMGAACAVLAGCGHTTSVGAGGKVQMVLTEYRVVPQSIRARAGDLTLDVENDGRLAHTLAISSHGTVLGQTAPLQPGMRTILVLTLAPGRYLMTSTLLSDQALGLYGTLMVVR